VQGGIRLAHLAEESGASPSRLGQWRKEALEGLESVFAQAVWREQGGAARVMATWETRTRESQEVATELLEEVLPLRKMYSPARWPISVPLG